MLEPPIIFLFMNISKEFIKIITIISQVMKKMKKIEEEAGRY